MRRGQLSRVRPRRKLPRAGVLAVATLAIVLALTVGLTAIGQGIVNRRIENELASEAESFVATVEDAVGDVELRLVALSGLFRASEEVTAAEYRQYANIVGLGEGMGGMAYMPIVETAALAEFQQAAAAEFPDYRVFEMGEDGRRIAPRARALHFPVLFFEPVDSLQRPHGLDAGSPPGRLSYLIRAVETRETTATPLLDLATTNETGFLMFFPVIEASGEVSALVASPVIFADLMTSVTLSKPEMLSWTVRDITDAAAASGDSGGFVHRITAHVANRIWEFELSPAPGSPLLAERFRHHWVLLAGILFGLAAATAVYLWVRGAEAKHRVAALKEGLKAKDRFVATVSHELRTPLTGVVGIAEVLRDNMTDVSEEERRELVSMLADEAADLSDIVEDLLVMARAGRGTLEVALEPVDVAREVRRVVGARPVAISSSHPGLLAHADPNRVRQVVRNLLNNAAAHGGPDVRVIIGADEQTVHVDVVDNGTGVPVDESDAIFDPYRSLHPQGGKPGSIGLGLSVARTLSRNMGGDLDYRRTAGETVFRMSLPAAPLRSPESADRRAVGASLA